MNCRFEAIRANRSHVMKNRRFFLRIDSRESPWFVLRIAWPSKFMKLAKSWKLVGPVGPNKNANFASAPPSLAEFCRVILAWWCGQGGP